MLTSSDASSAVQPGSSQRSTPPPSPAWTTSRSRSLRGAQGSSATAWSTRCGSRSSRNIDPCAGAPPWFRSADLQWNVLWLQVQVEMDPDHYSAWMSPRVPPANRLASTPTPTRSATTSRWCAEPAISIAAPTRRPGTSTARPRALPRRLEHRRTGDGLGLAELLRRPRGAAEHGESHRRADAACGTSAPSHRTHGARRGVTVDASVRSEPVPRASPSGAAPSTTSTSSSSAGTRRAASSSTRPARCRYPGVRTSPVGDTGLGPM